jgi:hypothetical protein
LRTDCELCQVLQELVGREPCSMLIPSLCQITLEKRNAEIAEMQQVKCMESFIQVRMYAYACECATSCEKRSWRRHIGELMYAIVGTAGPRVPIRERERVCPDAAFHLILVASVRVQSWPICNVCLLADADTGHPQRQQDALVARQPRPLTPGTARARVCACSLIGRIAAVATHKRRIVLVFVFVLSVFPCICVGISSVCPRLNACVCKRVHERMCECKLTKREVQYACPWK